MFYSIEDTKFVPKQNNWASYILVKLLALLLIFQIIPVHVVEPPQAHLEVSTPIIQILSIKSLETFALQKLDILKKIIFEIDCFSLKLK